MEAVTDLAVEARTSPCHHASSTLAVDSGLLTLPFATLLQLGTMGSRLAAWTWSSSCHTQNIEPVCCHHLGLGKQPDTSLESSEQVPLGRPLARPCPRPENQTSAHLVSSAPVSRVRRPIPCQPLHSKEPLSHDAWHCVFEQVLGWTLRRHDHPSRPHWWLMFLTQKPHW